MRRPAIVPSNYRHPITDDAYNISTDGSCKFKRTGNADNGDNVNPMLDPAALKDNGGPTKTIALLPDSPAIDQIPDFLCPKVDQRGSPRPAGHQLDCDIGAYELQDTTLGARATCQEDAFRSYGDCLSRCNGLGPSCADRCADKYHEAAAACDH